MNLDVARAPPIIVSNHSEPSEETLRPTTEGLAELVNAGKGKIPLPVDAGVRGADGLESTQSSEQG